MQLLVVASDEVGLPECVLAPWGFLAAPGNPRALAQALRRALALGPQERSRAGDQARAWVKRHADVDSQTARMSAVIDRTDESTRDLRWSPHNAVKRGRREN
jgi:glycosyltransferase involved in cell wall biosynthesis